MHKLLLELSPERLAVLYGSLEPPLQATLDGAIARVLNARVDSVRRRPEALRAKALRAFLARQRDDEVAEDLLRAYLLGPRKGLVTGFLDATGTQHEEGQVLDDAAPEPGKVAAAVAALLEEHDAEDVRLYLSVAVLQWPELAELRAALDGLQPAGQGGA